MTWMKGNYFVKTEPSFPQDSNMQNLFPTKPDPLFLTWIHPFRVCPYNWWRGWLHHLTLVLCQWVCLGLKLPSLGRKYTEAASRGREKVEGIEERTETQECITTRDRRPWERPDLNFCWGFKGFIIWNSLGYEIAVLTPIQCPSFSNLSTPKLQQNTLHPVRTAGHLFSTLAGSHSYLCFLIICSLFFLILCRKIWFCNWEWAMLHHSPCPILRSLCLEKI